LLRGANDAVFADERTLISLMIPRGFALQKRWIAGRFRATSCSAALEKIFVAEMTLFARFRHSQTGQDGPR
jgi:hypothetical protein